MLAKSYPGLDHKQPVDPEYLAGLLELRGFERVEVRRLRRFESRAAFLIFRPPTSWDGIDQVTSKSSRGPSSTEQRDVGTTGLLCGGRGAPRVPMKIALVSLAPSLRLGGSSPSSTACWWPFGSDTHGRITIPLMSGHPRVCCEGTTISTGWT